MTRFKKRGWAMLAVLAALVGSPVPLRAETYTLQDLYRIALRQSEKVRLSEENVAITGLTKEKALSVLFPRLTAYGGYVRFSEDKYTEPSRLFPSGQMIQPNATSQWGVRLDQSFSLSARELTALRIAQTSIEMTRYTDEAFKNLLLEEVARAYYQVLQARKIVEIAQANVERLMLYRQAAEKRLKVGEATRTVLLRAEGELSGARSDLLQAQNAGEMARAYLARLVGLPEIEALREETGPGATPLDPLDIFQDKAFRTRADLKAMDRQRQIAADQVRYARGAFWPNVALTAAYARADQEPAAATLNRESLYGGVSLNFPFFEGGLRTAELQEARRRETQAELSYQDLKKTIAIEVRGVYLDLATQRGVVAFLVDQLVFARDNYQAVSRQFSFGLANSVDVMDANTLLVSSERKLAEATYSYHLSLLRMDRAMGILYRKTMGDGQGTSSMAGA
jgi:outer membrane protein